LRRNGLLALIACIVGIGFANAAGAATTVRVGNSSTDSFNFLPLAFGMDKKFFQQNGIEIEVIGLSGTAKLHQAMVAGAIDLGLGGGTDIPFLVKGAPEIGVGAIELTPAVFGIVIQYNSPIHSLADLKHKRIGISSVGSITQWIVLELARRQGWKENDFTLVEDGGVPAPQVALLVTDQIDAQVTGASLGWVLEGQKKGRLLAPVSDFVGAFLSNVIYASDNIVTRDPAAIRAFLKGWYQTIDFMAHNRAETITMARAINHYPQEIAEKVYDTVMPSLSRDGQFPPDAVAPVRQSFVDLHILDTAPDMSKYLTTRFLPPKE
jgi:ABC-type nitrate/sulfonate/bicarbonate transport system substrate-binding protein